MNPIAASVLPTALPKNTSNPTKKRRSSTQKINGGLNPLKHLPTIKDIPLKNVQNAHETARKVGRTNGRTRDIAETGWLFAVVTWHMQYVKFNQEIIEISKGSTHKVGDKLHRFRYKIAVLKDRLQRAQQSLNPDALQNLSDEEKVNFLNYLDQVASECEGRLRMLIENGHDRLMGNTNALALRIVLPDPLTDLETLRRLPQIADDEMPQDLVNEAIGILSSITKNAKEQIHTSGLLPLVMRVAAGDVTYRSRLLDLLESLNRNTLANITDECGQAAVKKYLLLLAEKSTPSTREVIENALVHFNGNSAARATVPSALENPNTPSKQSPNMETSTTQTIANPGPKDPIPQISSDIDPNATSTLGNENPQITTATSTVISDPIDFGEELPLGTDIPDMYFQNPDNSVNSFPNMQDSFSCSDLNNSMELPDQDDPDIQSTVMLQDTTASIPPPKDATMTATASNATPTQLTAPVPNTSTVVPEREQKNEDCRVCKNFLQRIAKVNRQGLTEKQFLAGVEKLNLIGIVKGRNGKLVGLLESFVCFCDADQAYSDNPNRNLQMKLSRYRSYLLESLASIQPLLLGKIDDNTRALAGLFEQHYNSYGEILQNALARLQWDPNAFATIPSILGSTTKKNLLPKSRAIGTPTLQLATTLALPPFILSVMSAISNQATHKLNNGTMPVTVNQKGTSESPAPASPSNITEGATASSRDETPTIINSSIPEPHETNDMALNGPHADTVTRDPVDLNTLEQKVDLLIAEVTSLKKLISQLVTNSNLGK